MKRLLHSLFGASVAVILAATHTVGASDKQTLDPAQDNTGGEAILVAQNAAPSNTAKVCVDSKGVILRGCDAVAFFRQGKPAKGNPGIESTYQGAIYLFASTADKSDFDREPVKYAPQYGGFCAYGVAYGVLADIEGPDGFVYKGKLYVCGDKNAGENFRTDLDNNIEKADTNWQKLSGS